MEWDSEEFCRERFSKYLKDHLRASDMNWQRVPQGQDPPDFYLTLGDTTFAVEVTQTEVMRTVNVGTGQLRQETYESTHTQLVKEVQEAAQHAGILNGTYAVQFFGPMTASGYRQVKKHVLQELLRYIERTQHINDSPTKVVFCQHSPVCWVMKFHSQSNKVCEVFQWWEWSESPDIKSFVCRVLQDAVAKKRQKLEKQDVPAPRILLLLNTFLFATQAMYQDCLHSIHSLDFFHSAFVVWNNGSGFLLYTYDEEWSNFI